MLDLHEIIWQIVASIPQGKVATYGQIAQLAGYPGYARFVGQTLKKLPKGSQLPWFRVINAQGKISFPKSSDAYKRQYEYLQKEGIVFKNERISLAIYAWNGE